MAGNPKDPSMVLPAIISESASSTVALFILVPTVPAEAWVSRSPLVPGHRRKALSSFEILPFIIT